MPRRWLFFPTEEVGEETVFIGFGDGDVLGTEGGDYIVLVVGDQQEPPA